MVNSVNLGEFNPNVYGCIKKTGLSNGDRVLYSVFDSAGNETEKLSVPKNQVDKFEKSYTTILETAPQIKEYVRTHSSNKDIKKRKYLSAFVLANESSLKQVLATGFGIFTGLTAGLLASLNIMTPPGTYKFTRAKQELKLLDIRTIKDK